MLDKNDKRYIVRRVITYIIISLIMLLFSSLKVKAISSVYITNQSSDYSYYSCSGKTCIYRIRDGAGNYSTIFPSAGKGKLIFGFGTVNTSNQVAAITNVYVSTNNGNLFMCEYGTSNTYTDNTNQFSMYSVSCDVDLIESNGINAVYFKRQNTTGTLAIFTSDIATFVEHETTNINNSINVDTSGVINAVNNARQEISNHLIDIYSKISQQNSQVVDKLEDTNDNIQAVNDSITSEDSPSIEDVSGNANDWASNNAQSGVINQLVLMPITLLQSIVNGINNSCSSYSFGSIKGQEIVFPCINLSSYLGSLWNIIDVIISGIFIFVFGNRCVKIFNDFTNLKSGQIDTLYGGEN